MQTIGRRIDIHVRRMANISNMNVQAAGTLSRDSHATQSDQRMDHKPTVIFDDPRKSMKEFLTTDFADFTDKHT